LPFPVYFHAEANVTLFKRLQNLAEIEITLKFTAEFNLRDTIRICNADVVPPSDFPHDHLKIHPVEMEKSISPCYILFKTCLDHFPGHVSFSGFQKLRIDTYRAFYQACFYRPLFCVGAHIEHCSEYSDPVVSCIDNKRLTIASRYFEVHLAGYTHPSLLTVENGRIGNTAGGIQPDSGSVGKRERILPSSGR